MEESRFKINDFKHIGHGSRALSVKNLLVEHNEALQFAYCNQMQNILKIVVLTFGYMVILMG